MGMGGLIRNEFGRLKLAFAKNLDQGTNNMAELLALYYGLKHCTDLGLQQIEVEMDSLLIVNWLEKKRCGIWYLEDYWEEILQILSSLRLKIRHVYRECNAEAGFLARLASRQHFGMWVHLRDVPHQLKGILRVDKLGLPAMRC
ncbi:uncharacterized protein LOC121236547 [Juglans microcarpa x Juglans regia]|uniref:uncharacterized protein LOC121236547 n=1 Tax=Juglans microcarpa x Juglans regia TaxID=2249226 RepID=UPI001B7DC30F|nr:uncharacterized protein LOC121236547 [Juglans microcarpa x Juglans regia]